jgi:hypothetical protein
MEDQQHIEEELLKNAQNVKEVNILFLDISSTCIGYAVATCDFETKKANIKSAGGIWLPDVDHGAKYNFGYTAIVNYFDIVHKIDFLVYEQYSINPKKMSGISVVPEMIGAIKAATSEIGIKYTWILPQSWRSILKIKKTPEKDFKQPTKEKVLELVAVPEKILSNISRQERNTPSDVYDALAIGTAWLKKMNFKFVTYKDIKFQEHVGIINEP